MPTSENSKKFIYLYIGDREDEKVLRHVGKRIAFLLGMVGALAPEIVRLYSIRNNPTKFKWSWFYLVVSILFACLGGIFAFVLTAATYYSALYIGISTPVLINTVIKKGIESSTSELKQGLVAPAAKYSTYRSFVEGLYL